MEPPDRRAQENTMTTTTQTSLPTTNERNWGAMAHLSAFVQFLGIPSFVGPLAVWIFKKDEPYASEQAKEALNFNISMAIYFVASLLAIILLIGILLVPVVVVTWFILVVVATIKASNGEDYEYPLTIHFIN
jgi:uncharacterized Tic20 family protein